MYKVQLNNFEGPIDLLLYFIRRDELDIYDIPISEITKEFIRTVEEWKKIHLHVAGDFIVMASTLMRIKAKLLLPRPELDDEGEIIDPRTYSPLDETLIYESVKKTGKVIIIDESNPKSSLASEISSLISENCFNDLKAPILKLTAPHTPVPFSPPMEDFYIPSTKKIIKGIKTILKY